MKGTREQVSEWLGEVGGQQGVSLGLDANGICLVEGENKQECAVEVPEESEYVYLYAPIMVVPVEGKEALFEKLLSYNLYGLHTNQATLALDSRVNRIVLYYSARVEFLDSITFSNIFNNFIHTIHRIVEELSDFSVPAGSEFASGQDFMLQYPQLRV